MNAFLYTANIVFFPIQDLTDRIFSSFWAAILDPRIDKKTRSGAPKTGQKSDRSKNYFFGVRFRNFGRSGCNFLRFGDPNWVSGETF